MMWSCTQGLGSVILRCQSVPQDKLVTLREPSTVWCTKVSTQISIYDSRTTDGTELDIFVIFTTK